MKGTPAANTTTHTPADIPVGIPLVDTPQADIPLAESTTNNL
jgi:hypothetical protein